MLGTAYRIAPRLARCVRRHSLVNRFHQQCCSIRWRRQNAGFSQSEKTIRPVVSEGDHSYTRFNVERQRRDPDSLLNWISTLIRLRRECPEIGWSNRRILPAGTSQALAICYEWRGTCVVVVHNTDRVAHTAWFNINAPGGDTLYDLLGSGESRADAQGAHQIAIEGYGSRWFRVGSLNYALERNR